MDNRCVIMRTGNRTSCCYIGLVWLCTGVSLRCKSFFCAALSVNRRDIKLLLAAAQAQNRNL